MHVYLILLVLGCVVIVYMLSAKTRRRTRHRRAMRGPFPEKWLTILKKNLPIYNRLPSELREELKNAIKVFLAEKSFQGCGGLEITDEIKVTIAAQACMLLLGRENECYPGLRSIVIYPSTYVAGGKGFFGGRQEPKSVRLGESWGRGEVVLSWSDVKHGAFNFQDGQNVTMHEFAHQLDQEDGASDGAPLLEGSSAYSTWAKVFSREFEMLQKSLYSGKDTVLDYYGATDPAEFFAVATESFFEKPVQLKEKHPDLFDELRKYYKVNPTEWG
jgi:hypothetical protein